MSFKINFSKKKATVIFNNSAEENEITNAFLEIVETVSIKKLTYIIFDCSEVVSYSIPADYLTRVKVLTRFSTAWNSDINIIFIATNSEIRRMATDFINLGDDLKWEYFLFDDMESTQKAFRNI